MDERTLNELKRVAQALDILADCGVTVLMSISAGDVQDCADDHGVTVSDEKAQLIARLIAKEWENGDEWQRYYDRMADMISAE